eukprot:s842_g21.t1
MRGLKFDDNLASDGLLSFLFDFIWWGMSWMFDLRIYPVKSSCMQTIRGGGTCGYPSSVLSPIATQQLAGGECDESAAGSTSGLHLGPSRQVRGTYLGHVPGGLHSYVASICCADENRGSFGPPILGSVPLFVILGILTLAAWNFYLTAVGFFELRFPGHQWAFIASMTYQATNVLGTTTMVKIGQKIPFKPAYVISIAVQLLMMLALPMLAFWSAEEVHGDLVTPSTWGFAAALACCAVLGLAESCFTSLICGLAGSTGDPKLMGAIMTGQGIVGVVPPILLISLKFLSGDPLKWKYEVVFCFFGTCAALQALGAYLVRYENTRPNTTMVEVVSFCSYTNSEPSDPARQLISGERSFGVVLKDVIPQLVNVSMVFVVTFVVFPGVAANWSPQLDIFVSKGTLGKDWYTTLVVGIFQIFDVVGRSTFKAFEKIGVSPKTLSIPVWLRLAFIPAFMLLQRRPNSIAAPWQDLLAFAVMALFALTNGWCSTLSMISGVQVSHPAEQHRAGVIMELGLILGIFAGSADMRHDELLRLGKFGSWLIKRLSPRPVFFLIPGAVAKGPPAALNAGTCAWPLYVELCTDMVLLASERWQKSPWARMDALMAVWAKTPMYLLPEKYQPAVALPDASAAAPAAAEEDAKASASTEPLSFNAED